MSASEELRQQVSDRANGLCECRMRGGPRLSSGQRELSRVVAPGAAAARHHGEASESVGRVKVRRTPRAYRSTGSRGRGATLQRATS